MTNTTTNNQPKTARKTNFSQTFYRLFNSTMSKK